jgi:hypothetical protein
MIRFPLSVYLLKMSFFYNFIGLKVDFWLDKCITFFKNLQLGISIESWYFLIGYTRPIRKHGNELSANKNAQFCLLLFSNMADKIIKMDRIFLRRCKFAAKKQPLKGFKVKMNM